MIFFVANQDGKLDLFCLLRLENENLRLGFARSRSIGPAYLNVAKGISLKLWAGFENGYREQPMRYLIDLQWRWSMDLIVGVR